LASPGWTGTAIFALRDDVVELFEVEADDWDAAMTEFHERMGYEPYKPMVATPPEDDTDAFFRRLQYNLDNLGRIVRCAPGIGTPEQVSWAIRVGVLRRANDNVGVPYIDGERLALAMSEGWIDDGTHAHYLITDARGGSRARKGAKKKLMTWDEARNLLGSGLVVTRESWAEKGYQLGLARDPINGIPTVLLTRGTQCWTGWEAKDEDKAADDWELVTSEDGKPYSFMSSGVREVL
jgi:hypothetical protein